jgi:hypothetical protein
MHLASWTATPIRDGYLDPRHFGNVNDDLTVFIQRRRLNICTTISHDVDKITFALAIQGA